MSSSPEETPVGRSRRLLAVRPEAAPADPVMATKLFVPPLGPRSVRRPRLCRFLDRAPEVRLTLVVAPAGWGKSTLVAQWLRDAGLPFGWLSLDAADDDVRRFWRYLLLAVQQAAPDVGSAALRRLDAAGTDVERDVLPELVNELTDAARDVVVALDDYHLVRSLPVHRSLTALLDRAPASLHVVISSRVDPPLSLGRLRVAGDLLEIRAGQLRFDVAEAAQLLGRASVPALSAGEVQRLVDRTEGWAAGLQLAALRLADRPDQRARGDFIERFTGADRHIVDYVGEEVLDALSPETHDFLLQTSVLPRLCAPLADAVTGRHDAHRLLEEIHRSNLFLVALDDEGLWYRYHQLFRDLLLFELGRAGLPARTALHRRAAEWFRSQGDQAEAVLHALASEDAELSGELIAHAWRGQFNLGHLQTVQGWLAALPPAQVAGDARLTAAQVWVHLDRGQLDEAGATLAAAELSTGDDAHVRVLRALHTFKTGDVPLAAEQLAAVPGRLTDPFLRTVQDLVAGVCSLWLGDAAQAASRLRRAATGAGDTDNRLAQIYAGGAQALVAVLSGDLDSAGTALEAVDTLVGNALGDAHFVAMVPALARARLAALRGRWDDAAASSALASELGGRGAGRVEQAAALITAAEAARHTGSDPGPWLARSAALLRSCADPGPVVRNWFGREQRAQRPSRPAGAAVTERLTEREMAILALLPTALSQRELAGSMFVSQNTVKTHLRAIYRKLGAESRDDAVLRARSLGML